MSCQSPRLYVDLSSVPTDVGSSQPCVSGRSLLLYLGLQYLPSLRQSDSGLLLGGSFLGSSDTTGS
jgi:hypothetical protein